MTLDELLKQNRAWLEQALKRPLFDQVDEKAVDFPEEQRNRRMAEIEVRIKELSRRKEEAAASFDRAIALEKAELDNLSAQKPPTAPTNPVKPKRHNSERVKGKRS
jgi:hypothetical protein